MEHKELIEKSLKIEGILLEKLCAALESGADFLDASEVDAIANAAHHMAENQKNHMEACYYEAVTEAMSEVSEAPDSEKLRYNHKMGYNHRHTNSGRFATRGNGNYMGYNHNLKEMPYMKDYLENPEEFSRNMRMGYTDRSNWTGDDTRHGRSYNKYKDARRYYTQSHDEMSKKDMDRHMNEHIADFGVTVKEMYMDADPETKKKIKSDITKIINDMI